MDLKKVPGFDLITHILKRFTLTEISLADEEDVKTYYSIRQDPIDRLFVQTCAFSSVLIL